MSTYDDLDMKARTAAEMSKLNVGVETEWLRQKQIDEALRPGIEKGQTWKEFCSATRCPDTKRMRDRYLTMQRESGIAPGSVKTGEDPFLAGFEKG